MICEYDHQSLTDNGQDWTTHEELAENHQVVIRKLDENLYDLNMNPSFGIGQRALLVLSPEGNILWDCIAILDKPTIDFINSKGGLKAIAISHPHFYGNMNDWAETFNCPIFIHQADENFIVNKGSRIELWNGEEKELWKGIKLIHVRGHFSGSSILNISPKGVILCGDTFFIAPNKQHISVMHSYPNKIPLPISEIKRIKARMKPLEFNTIHAWLDSQSIDLNAKEIMEISLAKYV